MPRTTKTYHNFTKRLRDKLEALYNAHVPVKRIAYELGYSYQSIYRELKRGFYMHRNTDWTETKKYSAEKAQRSADINNTAKGAPIKLGKDRAFATFIEEMILKGYSPEASLFMAQEKGFETKICVATLYSYIEKGIFLRISNKNLLRKKNNKKRKYHRVKTTKQLPKENSIEKRPSEVLHRTSFGHWEMDSVIGRRNKGETLLVLTERMTRMEIILKSPDKSAASTVLMLNRLERRLGSRTFRSVFRTITCDNGTEFSNTPGIEFSPYTRKRRTTLYYCHPYCSSERGSNENQNAFIRRFIPKGAAISRISEHRLSEIQNYINTYPRGIFNGETALKRFQDELQKLNISNF